MQSLKENMESFAIDQVKPIFFKVISKNNCDYKYLNRATKCHEIY